MENKPEQNAAGKKGYGKKPWWLWLLIYLVAATVVYAIIYMLFFTDGGLY